jgi:hypothetical protein
MSLLMRREGQQRKHRARTKETLPIEPPQSHGLSFRDSHFAIPLRTGRIYPTLVVLLRYERQACHGVLGTMTSRPEPSVLRAPAFRLPPAVAVSH